MKTSVVATLDCATGAAVVEAGEAAKSPPKAK